MIVLACATELETRHVLAAVAPGHQPGQPLFWGGRVFFPLIVGIGPVAAALTIGSALASRPEISGIINLGICGSFDLAALPLGAVCTATAEIWPEYGVAASDWSTPSFPHQMLADMPLSPPNQIRLQPETEAAALGLILSGHWTRGISLTVAGVSGDKDLAARRCRQHQASTENMEGFALALASRRHSLPFLEIRTVSNAVGLRDKAAWDFKTALHNLRTILPQLTGDLA